MLTCEDGALDQLHQLVHLREEIHGDLQVPAERVVKEASLLVRAACLSQGLGWGCGGCWAPGQPACQRGWAGGAGPGLTWRMEHAAPAPDPGSWAQATFPPEQLRDTKHSGLFPLPFRPSRQSWQDGPRAPSCSSALRPPDPFPPEWP